MATAIARTMLKIINCFFPSFERKSCKIIKTTVPNNANAQIHTPSMCWSGFKLSGAEAMIAIPIPDKIPVIVIIYPNEDENNQNANEYSKTRVTPKSTMEPLNRGLDTVFSTLL